MKIKQDRKGKTQESYLCVGVGMRHGTEKKQNETAIGRDKHEIIRVCVIAGCIVVRKKGERLSEER